MTRAIRTVIALALVMAMVSPTLSQHDAETHLDETVAQIPILSDFHEVIFKVWHTAWPERNVAMLAELLPEIKHFSDSLARVQLPGILRDKQKVWTEGTTRLQEIVSAYASAASPVDSQKLLDAAENLHSQYEKLVRITRPVLKEMDAFHQVLYMIYHHYLPKDDEKNLVASVIELKQKMEMLGKATLPDRLRKKEAAFGEARAALASSVQALDEAMVADNLKEFASKVEIMHADYQALEKVFE